jgi:predicted phage tail protein
MRGSAGSPLGAWVIVQATRRVARPALTPDDEDSQTADQAKREGDAILTEIMASIRESAETQKTLWTHEKNSLVAHQEEIAKQTKALEEKLHAIQADAEQYGEALAFLQW